MPSSTESQFGSSGILKDRAIQERIAVAVEAQLGSQPVNSGVDAFSVTYILPAKDFGVGAFTEDIQGVPGFRGTVKDISYYDTTEVYSDADASVDIGIQGGDVDAYVVGSDIGVIASNGAASQTLVAGVIGTIPVGEDILVTGNTVTIGTTGISTLAITIQYFR